jgi:hypothetical protein
MKLLFISCLMAVGARADVTGTLVNYLREAPMELHGGFEFDQTVRLGGTSVGPLRVPIEMFLNRSRGDNSRGMSFALSESELRLNTDRDLSIRILGIPAPVNIRNISYREPGGFRVDVRMPLGIPLGQREIETGIREHLEKEFATKMQTAFQQLRTLRAQKNLSDIGRVTSEIRNIFTSGPGATAVALPGIRGTIGLSLVEERGRQLGLDQYTATLEPNTRITSEFGFTLRDGDLTINQIEARAYPGIRVSQVGDDDPMRALVFNSFTLDGFRFDMNYQFSAQQVIGMIEMIVRPNAECFTCNVPTTALRERVDPVLGAEISTLARRFQADLREMGVEQRILNVLYASFPPRG